MKRATKFPFISLKTAIERARELYNKEGRNEVNANIAVTHWGYGEKSSGGWQTVSALKNYGLIEDSGKSESRVIKLSKLALLILIDRREESKERTEAIKRAALNPCIFSELWQKWGENGLPSDATMLHYIVFEKEANENTAKELIKNFKETILVADLKESDKILTDTEETSEEGASSADNEPPVSTPSTVSSQPTIPLLMRPGMKQDVFSLEEGQVVIQWPESLSQESYEDFEGWINLILRRAKRSITKAKNDSEDNQGSQLN